MTTEELLAEARDYFAQLQRPAEELEVQRTSDYILFQQEDKDNLDKNGKRVLLLDLYNGKNWLVLKKLLLFDYLQKTQKIQLRNLLLIKISSLI